MREMIEKKFVNKKRNIELKYAKGLSIEEENFRRRHPFSPEHGFDNAKAEYKKLEEKEISDNENEKNLELAKLKKEEWVFRIGIATLVVTAVALIVGIFGLFKL